MPLITEIIVSTRNENGAVHLAPMGMRECEEGLLLAPFRPSTTLENLTRERQAVINLTDDVQVFAGCLTGRRDWPTVPAERISGERLVSAQSHHEVEVVRIEADPQRPRFYCRIVHTLTHGSFRGLNRARAAVLEAAVLTSRLHLLSREKIDSELTYLQIAIDKTAGAEEQQAWDWLLEKIHQARATR